MSFATPWSTVIALVLVLLILIVGYVLRGFWWNLVGLLRPIAEGIGRSIETVFRRQIPPAATYDLACHFVLLVPLGLFTWVVRTGEYPELAAHLPVFIYLYFGSVAISFVIAFLLKLRW